MSSQQLAAIALQSQMAAIILQVEQNTIPEPPKVKPLKAHQMAKALNIQNGVAPRPAPRINQPKSGAALVRNEPCRRQ